MDIIVYAAKIAIKAIPSKFIAMKYANRYEFSFQDISILTTILFL